MNTPRALIIGGSLSGLFAATLLRRAGWQADVYERVVEDLAGRGAGIATHAEVLNVMQRAGIDPSLAVGLEVNKRIALDKSGKVIDEIHLPQVLTAWGRVYALLRQVFPEEYYHRGKQLARITQTSAAVTAHFSDGSSASGDLLVGADGVHSTVRATYLPECKLQYAGYVGWRGMVDETTLPPEIQAEIFPNFAFCLAPREQMIAYPVAGHDNSLEPGHRRYNFVWYRPTDEQTQLPRLMTDDSGHYHANGIAPGLIRAEIKQEAVQAARNNLAPQFAEIVRLTPQLFFQPIYDLICPRLVFDRVAIIGDAAFVARPHLGMGVTKAASDALALAEAVAAGDLKSLAQFERQRIHIGNILIKRARELGAYVQANHATEYEREMARRYSSPGRVMRDTAVAPSYA